MYAVNRVLANKRVVREGVFSSHKQALIASAWYKRRGIKVRIEKVNRWRSIKK